MGLKVYIDGKLYEKEDAKISVFDHGLLYGDGVFEGIRVYNGKVFRLREHLDRLFDSARYIMLSIPLNHEELEAAVHQTIQANGLRDAYIRLVITRGVGTLGLDPNKCSRPSVIIITDSITLYPEELYRNGLDVVTVVTMRSHPSVLNPRVKSLNYLNNILAKIDAQNAGVMEAIMLNPNGFVAECTGDNIFIVGRDTLLTPPLNAGILEGVTRGVVIELAREMHIPFSEADLTQYDLYIADECFLTGTAAEIIPVVKIDGRPIGTGKPGDITHALLSRFRELTRGQS